MLTLEYMPLRGGFVESMLIQDLAPGHSAKKMASPAAMTADARPRRESQLLLVIVALLPRQTSAGHCYQTTVPAYCCSSMHGGRSNLMHKPAALPNRA